MGEWISVKDGWIHCRVNFLDKFIDKCVNLRHVRAIYMDEHPPFLYENVPDFWVVVEYANGDIDNFRVDTLEEGLKWIKKVMAGPNK